MPPGAPAEPVAPPPAAPPPPPTPAYDPEPLIGTLSQLSAKCGAFNLPPLEARKLEDVNKRLVILYDKLRAGGVSTGVFERMVQLGQGTRAPDCHVAPTATCPPTAKHLCCVCMHAEATRARAHTHAPTHWLNPLHAPPRVCVQPWALATDRPPWASTCRSRRATGPTMGRGSWA